MNPPAQRDATRTAAGLTHDTRREQHGSNHDRDHILPTA